MGREMSGWATTRLERKRPRLHFPAQTSTGQPRRLRSSHTLPNRGSDAPLLARESRFASANGAKCKSLGQRPRDAPVNVHRALKARNKTCARTYFALSGLRFISQTNPGALPRAISFRAFSAKIRSRFRNALRHGRATAPAATALT
jgi:hypothetical protein